MFWPAPPSALFEWQAPQLRSLKIGPRPSCCVSVRPKFALAAANVVAFTPGSASPNAKLSCEVESSFMLPHPADASGSASMAASANFILVIGLLRFRYARASAQTTASNAQADGSVGVFKSRQLKVNQAHNRQLCRSVKN